jgi:zinc transporter
MIEFETFPGLVWAYHFADATSPGVALKARDTLVEALPKSGFLWLHLAMPDARVEPELVKLPDITSEIAALLCSRDRHPVLTALGATLTGTMPDFEREMGDRTEKISRFRFAATSRLLVTTRSQPLHSLEMLRQMVEKGAVFSSPSALFNAGLEEFETSLEGLIDKLDGQIDSYEDELFAEHGSDLRGKLGVSRREMAWLHRTLRVTARLLHRIDSAPPDLLSQEIRDVLERRSHHFAALDQDVVLLQERARLLYEEIGSRLQDRINHNLYVLSVVTVLLMPPTLVTGYFGMNSKDLFLQAVDGGSFYATLLVLASALGAWFMLRRKGMVEPP